MAYHDFLTRYFARREDGRAEPIEPPKIEPLEMPDPVKLSGKAKGGIIAAAITAALALVYVNEGGYVNHPNDRGGATRYGITEKVARQAGYTGHMRDFPKHCAPGSKVCADAIYTRKYIDGPGYRPLAGMSRGVFFEIVDSAVLHGPLRASRWFQESLNEKCGASLKVDGRVGPATVGAFERCQIEAGARQSCLAIVDRMDAKQAAFFHAIVRNRPSQRVFLKGWLAHRVGNVDRKECG